MAATLNFKFVANAAGLKKGVTAASKDLDGFGGKVKGIGASLGKAFGGLAVVAGIGSLTSALKDATIAAQEDATSQALLAQQLKTTTGATDSQVAATESAITQLSLLSGIADDKLRPALANAVRGTGDLATGQKLLAIAIDGSAASGKPLDSVLQALIKANNGNTTSLYKLAPQLKETKGGIDDFAASVKGAGETAASPFAKLQVATGEINESVGKILLPTVQKFATYFSTTMAPAIQKFFDDVNNPKTETGKNFATIKNIVGEIWTTLQEVAGSKAFKTFLGTTISLALTLLNIAKNIAEAFGSKNDSIKGAALSFSTSSKQTLLTDANIQQAAQAAGGKKLTAAQLKRARANLSGGADGNPMTPWPFATGGVVMPRPGGTLGLLAEAGKPEAVIPLDRLGSIGGGNTYVININKASITGEEVIRAIKRYEVSTGRSF
jgi:hypothetical protein